jgi:hypothetical protein
MRSSAECITITSESGFRYTRAAKKHEVRMSDTRRDFLRRVAQAGGYRATYLTMQAMGLLGTAAVAEPLALEPGNRHGTKVAVLGAGLGGLRALQGRL